MSVTAADLNNDGWHGHLRRQRRDGELLLREPAARARSQRRRSSSAWPSASTARASRRWARSVGDVNRDGRLDIYIPNLNYGSLLVQAQGEFYEDLTDAARVSPLMGQYTGWGAVLFDLRQRWLARHFIVHGNAHHEYVRGIGPRAQQGQRHVRGRGSRRRAPTSRRSTSSRGATWADFDNDGDIDLLVVNLNDSPQLLRNDGGNTEPLADGGRHGVSDRQARRPSAPG